jgi:cytidylate kinase
MIVTIDGPAGAGKSSAARELARRLGFRFLDTGAMYRAVTWAAKVRGLDLADADALAQLAREIRVELAGDRVLVDGRDVTKEIRTFEITTAIQYAADNPAVRAQLVEWQRAAANSHDVVTEGRDQGTVVFPQAECKIFLTADEGERARRRYADLVARGEDVSFDEVLSAQQTRDERDRNRPVGALVKADDAIEVSTNQRSPQEVVAQLEEIVRSRQH